MLYVAITTQIGLQVGRCYIIPVKADLFDIGFFERMLQTVLLFQ